VAATRAVLVTLFLLIIILYVFGVGFKQLTTDTVVGTTYFSGVLSSMHSLVIFGIQYDGVTDLMDLIQQEDSYILIFPFYLFVLLASLTVLNMLIGVLCEVIGAVASCEQEELQIHYVREKLLQITERQCTKPAEGELKIDKEHFLLILQDEFCAGLLHKVKVEPFSLVDLVDTLFINQNGEELVLHVSDLVELIMDQRSCNISTVKDVTELRKFVKGRLDQVELSVKAKALALGRLVERGLGLPKGSWDAELAKAHAKRALGLSAELAEESRLSDATSDLGNDGMEKEPEAKPWEIPSPYQNGSAPSASSQLWETTLAPEVSGQDEPSMAFSNGMSPSEPIVITTNVGTGSECDVLPRERAMTSHSWDEPRHPGAGPPEGAKPKKLVRKRSIQRSRPQEASTQVSNSAM